METVTAGYVKVAGAWKALFNSGLNFTETAAGFGNANGNTVQVTVDQVVVVVS